MRNCQPAADDRACQDMIVRSNGRLTKQVLVQSVGVGASGLNQFVGLSRCDAPTAEQDHHALGQTVQACPHGAELFGQLALNDRTLGLIKEIKDCAIVLFVQLGLTQRAFD